MPRFFAVDAAAAERIKNKQARRGAEAQRRRDNNKTEEAQRIIYLHQACILLICNH